jgi:Tfp pilus assembly protein PilV
MSLPEVLIAVTLLGLIVGTLAMVSSVILRQLDNTQGRTNNARSEQNVSIWMPTDLSSAESVSTDPAAVPCGLSRIS